jgi:hypothetical protein
MASPKHNIDEMAVNQASKYITFNNLVRQADAKLMPSIVDKDLVTSPSLSSSDYGKCYIVAGTGGDWSTYSVDDVAQWYDDAWYNYVPQDGWFVYVEDEDEFYYFTTGSGWTQYGGGTDADAIHDNVGGEIDAITLKGTLVGADILLIEDSETSGLLKKKTTIADIDHNLLTNYNVTQHRIINDAGTSTTELWSASKIDSEISSITPGGAGSDTDAIHDNVGGEIDAITSKIDVVGADILLIEDSETSGLQKKSITVSEVYPKHIMIPATSLMLRGVSDPDIIGAGVYGYGFDPDGDEEVFASIVLPSWYPTNKDLTISYNWVPFAAGTGSVNWGCQYARAEVDAIFSGATTITVADPIEGAGEQFYHKKATFAPISGTGYSGGHSMFLRIFRDADSSNDDYAGDAILMCVCVNFE